MFTSGGQKSYVVECYLPNVDKQGLAETTQRAQEAADAFCRQGRDLRFVGSILVLSEETVFYLFDGDEEDVVAITKQAGVRFERVLESIRIDGGTRKVNEEVHTRA
jgi:hypothetical protein